ncbi:MULTISPECIES: succinate dehydrogenase assembly factor 2 [Marivita]|uniref:FAD assembly factor SdhE n=1 Tax=Marivita cryptomonadis TaxID=505252 RepID=A0A9Q2S1P1_9RHOB|nr:MULTISPECIES: succinate dehydrogenase assembly factor 2 [Marivita]MCR9170222.1 succinate dehydrogenase assembly factor 2 [Paracoccaceae bacterium]MBM2323566.1 succinate dehydrogenase assembly factor 2 [Marivita cryptomonadis]MBM2333153.1 succinate dehydrogenase assembly factor 2 [Marivita cryptomonadis]MBM2342732.1 succinate dehydrogenase assembly factor 2 [Marivita cryptomonadis]MBM2347401.1 succinate dehydrogenase assembly factor 2 [Marivita cryptomonadis]
MNEPREHRLKRLSMRSMRRGIKEMDIILSRYAEQRLEGFDDAMLDRYDTLLSENDQDLYQWVSGQKPAPDSLRDMIADISEVAFQR